MPRVTYSRRLGRGWVGRAAGPPALFTHSLEGTPTPSRHLSPCVSSWAPPAPRSVLSSSVSWLLPRTPPAATRQHGGAAALPRLRLRT